MSIIAYPFSKIGGNGIPRPILPITISNPHTNKSLKAYGIIDTGADECALPAGFAPILGHNLQKGTPKHINTGNGVTIAYAHTISIKTLDFQSDDIMIDFLPNLSVPLLGVKSFLGNFILTINYLKQTFSLDIS
jgi:hypothetical protein